MAKENTPTQPTPCDTCGGDGGCVSCAGFSTEGLATCGACDGSGKCADCNGTGK